MSIIVANVDVRAYKNGLLAVDLSQAGFFNDDELANAKRKLGIRRSVTIVATKRGRPGKTLLVRYAGKQGVAIKAALIANALGLPLRGEEAASTQPPVERARPASAGLGKRAVASAQQPSTELSELSYEQLMARLKATSDELERRFEGVVEVHTGPRTKRRLRVAS